MKNKTKKIPKTHLPKYGNGGDATSNLYNDKRSNSLTTDQKNSIYSTLGAAGTSYAMSNNQAAYSDPNYKVNNSSKGAWQSTGGAEGTADSIQSGVASAIPQAALFHGISESAQSAVGTQGANAGAQYFFEPHKLITHAIDGEGLFNAKDREEHGLGKLNGGIRFAMGGVNPNPNAEIEKQENVVAPNGGFLQADGPSHEQGGVPVKLPGNSMIFSDRLKAPGTKKTFADLNKVNNTNKEDKILDSNKTSSMSKRTAELMKFVKNKNSETLFNEQEALKQAKVEAYAKKMGVNLNQSQEAPQEFAMGGVKLPMYPYGGDLDVNMLSYGGDDPRFYNYQGNKVVKPNLNALNKDKGVSPNIGLNNYNNLLTTRAQVRDSKVLPTTTLPKFEYINDPSKGSYDEQFNVYKKVYLSGFRYGGKLPKYWDGGESEDNPLGYKPTNKVDQMRMQQALWNSQNKPSSSSWLTPEMMQASSDALIEEGYTNPSSPVINTTPTANTYPIRRDKNGKLIFDTPTSSTSSVGTKRDQELYDEELARMNASGGRDSNKFDWKNTLGQVGNFAAQNAGNIYNLSRYNKPEVERYERAKATLLDPAAAIRNAMEHTRRAEYNVRGASGGNAGTYLSNRVALNAQNINMVDAIRQQYANANAGISNDFAQYNNKLAMQEVIANAMNRARTRSGKGEAIGSLGSNIANQMMDNKKTNMDQETLQLMMKYYDTPEFKRMMKEYKGKK